MIFSGHSDKVSLVTSALETCHRFFKFVFYFLGLFWGKKSSKFDNNIQEQIQDMHVTLLSSCKLYYYYCYFYYYCCYYYYFHKLIPAGRFVVRQTCMN